MPAEIRFVAAANCEYLKARRWYETRAGELIAAEFVQELDRILNRLIEDATVISP